MVGNYGVDPTRSESARPHARAVLMREARGPQWTDWLLAPGGGAPTRGDTRVLVLKLRAAGARRGVGCSGDTAVDEALALAQSLEPMGGKALAGKVSTKEPYLFSDAGVVRVAVIDYGCKRSILRRLARAGAAVTVYPHDVDADELTAYDGVLLSNGPGDPEPLQAETETVRELLGRVPVFGICLGHQLVARAAGFSTSKLSFGHRGANHPVLQCDTKRVLVTAQNHGFCVDAADAPEVTHVSLYDGTVEGLALRD